MRMIDYKSSDGETINQLDELVNRIIWSLEPQNQKYRSVYELVLEEPLARRCSLRSKVRFTEIEKSSMPKFSKFQD